MRASSNKFNSDAERSARNRRAGWQYNSIVKSRQPWGITRAGSLRIDCGGGVDGLVLSYINTYTPGTGIRRAFRQQ